MNKCMIVLGIFVAAVVQLSFMFGDVSLLRAADEDVTAVVPPVTAEVSGAGNVVDKEDGGGQAGSRQKCPKCGKIYSPEMSFCSIDGEFLVAAEPESIKAPESIFSEKADGGATGAAGATNKTGKMSREESAVKFEAFKDAMEFIKSGDMFRIERNDYKMAIIEYKKAEKLSPDNMQLHYKLAGAYWKLDDRDNALKHLDLCKEVYPDGAAGITKIDKFIVMLERSLSAEKKSQRYSKKADRMRRIMEKNIPLHKERLDEMVIVPEGKFIMGSMEDEFNIEEKPQHTVYLSAYHIDKYEVTNVQYWEFLDYITRTNDHSKCYIGEGPDKDHTPDKWYNDSYYERPDWPVVRLDWYDAYAYAAWAGKRLLTEAEWEKAARGTDGRRFPWGNVWVQENCNVGMQGSLKVGSYEGGKSVFGVYDMAGSVQEWCQDWHHAMYYSSSPSRDPKGPAEGTNLRVIRGSSLFANNVYQMRTAMRWYDEPHRRNRSVGFRCAKDVEATKP